MLWTTYGDGKIDGYKTQVAAPSLSGGTKDERN
jgi:hypothetical protein